MSHLRMSTAAAGRTERAPRYSARKRNGVWHLFDSYTYTAIDASYYEEQAKGWATEANAADALKRHTPAQRP